MELENTKIVNSKWIPTDKRFVAFLDLLGFKDKIMRKSHQEIYEELSEISRLKKSIENAPMKSNPKYQNCDIYVVSFSDSIVLFSKNDDFENFEYFLLCLRTLFSNAIRKEIALKGGIAHGEISINKSEQIYFGQPIIDAYLIEEDVNFLGVVAHNSIDKYLANNEKKVKSSHWIDKLTFTEKTPLKCGKISHLNLDYFILTQRSNIELDNETKLKNIQNLLDKFYTTVSGSPRRYIDNTKEFLDLLYTKNKVNLNSIKIEELKQK